DQGIFVGSLGLTVLLLLFSVLGFYQFVDLTIHSFDITFYLPLLIGTAGIMVNFVGGETDRKKLAKNFKPLSLYKFLFYLSTGVMIFAVALGAIMNKQIVFSTASKIPYIAAGIVIVFLVSFVLLKTNSSKPLPAEDQKEPPII